MDYWIHIIGGFLLLLYSLLAIILEFKSKKLSPESKEYSSLNNLFFHFNRIASWIAIIVFLLGGKRGTPYFKAGSGWIFTKLVLWLALMAILGALSGKSLKARRKGPSEDNSWKAIGEKTNKTMGIFIWVNLLLILSLMALGHFKPF